MHRAQPHPRARLYPPPVLDRFACYEACVQSPRHVTAFLRAVHAHQPLVLREDFCGTAAVSRRWIAEAARQGESARAVGVDLDDEALARAALEARRAGVDHALHLLRADVLALDLASPHAQRPTPRAGALHPDPDAADVVFVGNFSLGYIHARADLITYLRRSRQRLARGNAGFGGGIFACDLYGGASAFTLGGLERTHPGPGRELVRYAWRHDRADPLTGMVENSISFRVEVDAQIVAEHPRAFTYRWRLWSIAEVREALAEAAFARSAVYKDIPVAPGQTPEPVTDPEHLSKDWVVIVVGFCD